MDHVLYVLDNQENIPLKCMQVLTLDRSVQNVMTHKL